MQSCRRGLLGWSGLTSSHCLWVTLGMPKLCPETSNTRLGVKPLGLLTVLLATLGLAPVREISATEPPTPHQFLQRLCDDFGGRMTGTAANLAGLARLETELRTLGYSPERQT